MFPPELAIHVCSFLDSQTDKQVLLNCALVDSTWLSAAQPIIFRDLTLNLTSPRHEDHEYLSAQSIRAHENLLEALDIHPHLASYIRHLRLKNLENESSRGGKVTSWVNESLSLARVLRRLTNVRSLILFRVGYPTILPTLQEAIRNLFQLGSITSLDISYATFPSFSQFIGFISSPKLPTFISLSSLKFLEEGFSETPFTDGVTLTTPGSRPITRLHLSLIHIMPFISCFASPHCPFDFTSLETLHLHALRDIGHGSHSMMDLFRLVGNSLKHLELEMILGNAIGFLDLLPSLKTLTLAIQQTVDYSPVPRITSLLTASTSPPTNIESINLHFDVFELRAGFLPTFKAWRTLDSLFSDVSRFPALKTVTIHLPNDSALPLNVVEEQFQTLMADDRLKVVKGLMILKSLRM
ncbi:hypothetical protein E1B28_008378 [Marasmius oreades]|uniref:F-box domain-containing protein n=1 Tax=Marasmius oreades TaxID=181124 RepID=A0A9P7RYA9_9AGAR|nr:uncharacterized protein E1B28_008378 [Marasmius oreades]KAG7091991.1 hypothetical protein E1B28_008378 [Marasmius oreades]